MNTEHSQMNTEHSQMNTATAKLVHYTELKGIEAHAQLRQFLALLPTYSGFLGAELLASPLQPELFLLASRWQESIPELPIPIGAKAWAFEVLAEAVIKVTTKATTEQQTL